MSTLQLALMEWLNSVIKQGTLISYIFSHHIKFPLVGLIVLKKWTLAHWWNYLGPQTVQFVPEQALALILYYLLKGNGELLFGYIIDKTLYKDNLEVTLTHDSRITVFDLVSDLEETLDFKER